MNHLNQERHCIQSGTQHDCCFHPYIHPIWMVIPDGHIVMQCCICQALDTKRVLGCQRIMPFRVWPRPVPIPYTVTWSFQSCHGQNTCD